MIYKKRGISPVIATLLLVVLTLVVAGMISQVVIYFVKNQLDKGGECVPYRDYFIIDDSLGYTCMKNKAADSKLIGVSIKANSGDLSLNNSVSGFVLIFTKGGNSKSVRVMSGQLAGDHSSGNIWMLADTSEGMGDPIVLPVQGEITTYVYHSDAEYSKVEVAPILSSGSSCSQSSPVMIRLCSAGNDLEVT